MTGSGRGAMDNGSEKGVQSVRMGRDLQQNGVLQAGRPLAQPGLYLAQRVA